MAVTSHATMSTNTKKNNRKRGLSQLDLGCDDFPALKKHRISIKSTNSTPGENKENKENESNKFPISSFTSFSGKNSNISNITVTTINNNTKGKNIYDKSNNNKEKKEESIDVMDMDNIKKAINSTNDNDVKTNNNKYNNINNNNDDVEEEDIDIEMIKSNINVSNNGLKEEINEIDKMDCDNIASILGTKAKNIYDYDPKYRRSGLLFLVECGIGMEVSR